MKPQVLFLLAILLASFLFTPCCDAGSVTLYDGRVIEGVIQEADEKSITIETGETEKKTQVIPLFNVVKFRFDQQVLAEKRSQLLIDGWDSPSKKLTSKKVKLRKGYHRVSLVFLHRLGKPNLKVMIQQTGRSKQEISPRIFYGIPKQLWSSSGKIYDIDKEGYRIPIDVTGMKLESLLHSRVTYWEGHEMPAKVGDIRIKPLNDFKKTPGFVIPKLSTQENFTFVHSGLIRIRSDGEFTFFGEADKNSQYQLYIGSQPYCLSGQSRIIKSEDWEVKFSKKGKLVGRFNKWDENGLAFDIVLNSQTETLQLDNSTLEEIWKAKNPETVNRDEEPEDQDSLYAKDSSNNIQRISGEVLGYENGKIKFRYLEKDRTISLDKVVGLVLKKNRKTENEEPSGVVQLLGPYQIPGTLLVSNINDRKVRLASGKELKFKSHQIVHTILNNSRLQSLADLTPINSQHIPFFTRKIPFSINQSLEGKSLRIGNQVYPHGLCVHSKTVLEYALDGKFETFKAEIGLQYETGKFGNVSVQILGDDEVLYENEELTTKSKSIPLKLKIDGRKKLTLIVDFGKGQDVGDRFVWGNPQLIRSSIDENSVSSLE